jgi:SAM-dependent methyltransferase
MTKCRLCGGNDLRLIMTDGHNRDLNYYRCEHCALWNYDLDCGLDQTQYTESYVSPRDAGFMHNVHQRKTWDFLKKRLGRPGKMMDIGCGNGGLLYLAREDGWQVQGLELSASAARSIKEDTGIDVAVGDFLEYAGEDAGSYDLVALRHVLEHLPDSVLAMQQIGRMLKPAGLALLEFPNTASAAYAYKRFLKNHGLKNKKYSQQWRPGHCNEFCRKAFEFLLDKTGFELLEWHTYSNKPLPNFLFHLVPVGSKARVLVRKLV